MSLISFLLFLTASECLWSVLTSWSASVLISVIRLLFAVNSVVRPCWHTMRIFNILHLPHGHGTTKCPVQGHDDIMYWNMLVAKNHVLLYRTSETFYLAFLEYAGSDLGGGGGAGGPHPAPPSPEMEPSSSYSILIFLFNELVGYAIP